MVVNHSVAQFSDVAYFTAFIVYFIALVLSICFYVKQISFQEVSRKLEASRKQAVLVGGGDQQVRDADAAPSVDTALLQHKQAAAARFAGMTQTMVWLGIVVNFVSIVLRGLSAHRFPFGNLYEYVSLVACGIMILVAAVVAAKRLPSLWPWVLVPVLALMFFGGTKLYAASAPVMPALQSVWLPIHVFTVIVGACIAMVSGLASLMFLVRTWADKKKPTGRVGRVIRILPDAELLDAIAYKTAIWALPIFGLAIALGAIWAEKAWGRFWNWDPKEVMSFVTWIILAAYLHARATPTWKRTLSAWINVAAFVSMVFNLFVVNLVFSGMHSYAGVN